jgi:SAM-dependent methyltransferase
MNRHAMPTRPRGNPSLATLLGAMLLFFGGTFMNSAFHSDEKCGCDVVSKAVLQEGKEKCVRNSSPDTHQHVSLTSNIIKLTSTGFFSNSSNYDWLAAAIFGRGSYENLSVGNPQNRDNWILVKAKELGSKGKKLIDLSAGNKPYEDTFRKHGFEYYSS